MLNENSRNTDPQRNGRLGKCEELPPRKNFPVVKSAGDDSLINIFEFSTPADQLNQGRYKNG